MESNEQATMEHSTNDQPNEVTGDEANMQSQTFDVGGQQLTWEKLLENYKKLQGEFTKSRQELSETKKTSELSPEDKAAIDFIKNNWFVTKDDLDGLSKRQAQESNLKEIIAANPDLQQYESAIRAIWKDGDMAYEDIIQKYGFKSWNKLAKARSQWDVKWMPEKKEKPISEMSSTEYAKYKADMGWTWNRGTFN